MFHHIHPYPPFILPNSRRLIVGTLPPPRFTTGMLNTKDVDFCYGSSNGMLWPILDKIYDLNLSYENSAFAIEQRRDFLSREGIGVCDIVASAKREKVDASDLGMREVELRDICTILKIHKQVSQLIFTGGMSKNGPAYFFFSILKKANIQWECIAENVPRRHRFFWAGRWIETVALTAPSGAANRAIGSMKDYKKQKSKDPIFSPFDFRVLQYQKVFLGE